MGLAIAMLILGCSETPAPCVPLLAEKARYTSVESCEAESAFYLERHLDKPWPVLMARCLPESQLPALAQPSASGSVEQAGNRAFIRDTPHRLANEGRNREAPDFLRRFD